jgi:hypothetical protein
VEGVSYYRGSAAGEIGIGYVMGDSGRGDEFGLVEISFRDAFTASSSLFVLPVLLSFDQTHYVYVIVYGFFTDLKEFGIVIL